MKSKHTLIMLFCFILLYVLFYCGWLIYWTDDPSILILGGNSISAAAPLIAAIGLFLVTRKTNKEDKPFWMLLTFGCFSYFIAEFIWIIYENGLKIEVPFPGYTDLFYMLQIVFFLSAFIYKIKRDQKVYRFVRFIFDVLIVVTVASTFSWHFLIKPIIEVTNATGLFLFVSIGYPVGDLVLILGAATILYGSNYLFQRRELLIICLALIVQVVADSIYLYLLAVDQYVTGSLVDPLYSLALLLMGYAGIYHHMHSKHSKIKLSTDSPDMDNHLVKRLFPYVLVLLLFLFMAMHSKGLDAFTAGTGLAILLVMIRQVLIINENNQLLEKVVIKSKALAESQLRYKSLFVNHPDAVCSLDLEGNFVTANPVCKKLLGYEKEELLGQSFYSLLDQANQNKVRMHMKRAIEGISQSYEVTILDRCEEILELHLTNIPIIIDDKIFGVFCVAKDITVSKQNEEKISYMAYHDALTGLSNRSYFDETLVQAILDAKRNQDMLAVMYIDLDRFKIINDTLGHSAGDELLTSVARRLKDCLRENDTVARQGGDEFSVLAKGIQSIEDADHLAQKVLNALSGTYYIVGQEFTITPSIGVAIYPKDGDNASTLIQNADMAMYRVKGKGKNHYSLYNTEQDDALVQRSMLEKDLQQALKKNEFTLHYQPQFDIVNGTMCGVEALLRWNHPQLGSIPPGYFIAIAEETKQIIPIGEWVLQTACLQAKQWYDQGYPIKIGVNLSPKQFMDLGLVERTANILSEVGLDPTYLDLEITEALAMNHVESGFKHLLALKQLGVHISIDDFGTGYSSLAYLGSLPIDTLKIAGEFVMKIGVLPANDAIISSIITLAQNLGLNIMAEGVETDAQRDFLRQLNCQFMQGYLFSKPVTADVIESLFKQYDIKLTGA
jgi:diguanylate cyclase (GGDEF)-like protein/PAS domain S-box-containing protein